MTEKLPQEQNETPKNNVSSQKAVLSQEGNISKEETVIPKEKEIEEDKNAIPNGEIIPQVESVASQDESIAHLVESISSILGKLDIEKVYFVDDAIALDTNSFDNFSGLVNVAIAAGHLEKLREIQIQNALDFNVDEAVLVDDIRQKWDNVNIPKKSRYFKHVYTILGQPEAIKDHNEASHLKEYFDGEILECLTPNQWDDRVVEICNGINQGKRILVLFDQDLKLAEGRFADNNIKGEDLITELKARNLPDKILVSLFTHTITEMHEELPTRKSICDSIPALNNNDFFVLAKSRLAKGDLFADGIKKACLNTFCETIKSGTIAIIEEAQKQTVERLNALDTYDFDHTIFKSSFSEGVWEPETLLRITDVVFKDEVRKLMVAKNYVPAINNTICSAKEISDIEIEINQPGAIKPYNEKFKLRHQEIYESETLLNQLRRPIDNGDIFQITDGFGKNKKFILIAQECDLMVRADGTMKGKRGSDIATLIEVETLTDNQLLADLKRTYQSQIDKNKFTNHYFADRYQLEYFEEGTNKSGIVHFKKAYTIDLNVLDLIVFNETGEAALDVDNTAYVKDFHNFAWQYRYELIYDKFALYANQLDVFYTAIDTIPGDTKDLQSIIKSNLNHRFSFIEATGLVANYDNRKFNFGIKRISRLRMPKSKNLLDRYYLHLSRFAELHDFAKNETL